MYSSLRAQPIPCAAPALILTFDIAWMHCLAGILHHQVTEHLDPARMRVDFDIDNVGSEAVAGALGVYFGVPGDGTAG